MAWFIPPEPILEGDVLDVDDLNDNIQAFHSELEGELNEHNFDNDCLEDMLAKMATDFCLQLNQVTVSRDPHASGVTLPHSTTWFPIPGAEITFDTRGGDHYVVASWGIGATNGTDTRPTGKMYAIEVDGNVYPESLLGSGDLSCDFVRKGVEPGSSPYDFDSAPAWRGDRAFKIEMWLYLGAGQHTAKIVSRSIELSADDSSTRVPNGISLNVMSGW
jgi:hypothetical protein